MSSQSCTRHWGSNKESPALLILTVYEEDSHLLVHKNVNMKL